LICNGLGMPIAARLTGPTGMIRRKRCHSSMQFRRSTAREGDRGAVPAEAFRLE